MQRSSVSVRPSRPRHSFAPTRATTLAVAAIAAALTFTVDAPAQLAAEASNVAPLPRGLASFGCAIVDDSVFVYGGHCGRAHQHDRERQTGVLLRLDLSNPDRWHEIAVGPRLQSAALVAHAGQLYRVGGMQARNAAGEKSDLYSSDEIVRIDPATGATTLVARLPEPRSSHEAVVVGDRLYVFGGWTLAGADERPAETAWAFDLTQPSQPPVAIPALPPRRALAAAVVDGRIHAIGGMDEDGATCRETFVLDPNGSTGWQRGPDLPFDGFGAAACVVDGVMFVSARSGVVHRLDVGANAFVAVAPLVVPRFFHRLVPLATNRLLAIGGAARGPHLRWNECIPLDGAPIVQRAEIAIDGGPRQRPALWLDGDVLHVAGGNRSAKQHDFAADRFGRATFAVDLLRCSVERGADLPIGRQSMLMHADARGAVVVGGFGHDRNVGDARATAAVLRFDRSRERWDEASALPEPRTQSMGIVHDGAMLLFGGLDFDPKRRDDFRFPLEVLRIDLTTGAVSETAHRLPRARRAGSIAMLDERIVLVGGMADEFTPVDAVDVLDPRDGSWSSLPAPSATRVGADLLTVAGKLWLVGGSVSDGDDLRPATSIECFDPATSTWSTARVGLPNAMRHVRAIAWRERLLLCAFEEGRLVLTTITP